MSVLQELTFNTVYLMGISFVLGSLFTIFVLIILELMRTLRAQEAADQED